MTAKSVFSGLKVVDLSFGVAGPTAAVVLADFGATVRKMELPGGDPLRGSPAFLFCNRGKESTVLDPTSSGDRTALRQILAASDVCITNGAISLARYGLTNQTVESANPMLVIGEALPCEGDAVWSGEQESHGLLAASTGVALRQSSWEGGPIELVSSHLLYLQGIWMATCLTAALIERQESRLGQIVSVSGINAAMLAIAIDLAGDPNQVSTSIQVGPTGPNPCYTQYKASDGRWLLVGALDTRFSMRLITALGLEEILEDERISRLEDLYLPQNFPWVRPRFEAVFAAKTRDEWLEWLPTVDIPCGPLLTRDEWIGHDQLGSIGMRVSVEDPTYGTVVMPGIPVTLSETPGQIRGSAPILGKYGNEKSDYSGLPQNGHASQANSKRNEKGPLAGYSAIDFGTFVSGPTVGFLLAELGADVLKIESTEGDPFRLRGFAYNRGMRSLAIDLKDPECSSAVHSLIAQTDVVIDNYRPGVAPRLGIDYPAVITDNPDAIGVSISAFGESGELASHTGFDAVLEAYSGVMVAQGGSDIPVMISMPIIDVTAGTLAALGACLGLLARARFGVSQRVNTSLAAAAALFQAGDLVRYEGAPIPRQGGRDYRGAPPYDCFYHVTDGWIRVQMSPANGTLESFRAFLNSTGNASAMSEEDLGCKLASCLSTMDREQAVKQLAACHITAISARVASEVLNAEGMFAADLIHSHRRLDGGTYVTPGRAASFSRTQRPGKLTAPGIGEHSREVLKTAGLSDQTIDGLMARGAVVEKERADPVVLPRYR